MDLNNLPVDVLSAEVRQNPALLDEMSTTLSRLCSRGQKLQMFISFDPQKIAGETERVKKMLADGEELPLAGVPVALADNICTDDLKTTCGSRMLAGYEPPFSAALTVRLRGQGALLTGKANMEEFGIGCSGNSSYFGIVKSPWQEERIAGSGVAAAVSTCTATVGLASDTVGELRQAASYCGVLALRPSYGRISRRGIIDYASSMEQVGIMARSTGDLAAILQSVAGPDQRDPTSLNEPAPAYTSLLEDGEVSPKAAVPEDWDRAPGLEEDVKKCFQEQLDRMRAAGMEIVFVPLKHFAEAYRAAAVVSAVEAFSNLADYDGVRFGFREIAGSLQEMYTATRSAGFSSKVKKFLTFGALVSAGDYYERYFLKGQRMRTSIIKELGECLEHWGLLLTPTTPFTAPEAGGPLDSSHLPDRASYYTAAASLCGLPALTFPVYTASRMPAGLQFTAKAGEEAALLRISALLQKERALQFPGPC